MHLCLTEKKLNATKMEMQQFFSASIIIGDWEFVLISIYWKYNSRVVLVADTINGSRYFKPINFYVVNKCNSNP